MQDGSYPVKRYTTKKRTRKPVRVECFSCVNGYVDHMTVDELRERAAHDAIELVCPACGLVHLSREEIEEIQQKKITDSQQYKQLKKQAEASR
ncbi:MAG: hypothetical protein CSA33_02915 [Desulfobulbus propionicus]|nr:MAG: hypothetical protein CSA33_02915 [Desulfobulbus propionicus]